MLLLLLILSIFIIIMGALLLLVVPLAGIISIAFAIFMLYLRKNIKKSKKGSSCCESNIPIMPSVTSSKSITLHKKPDAILETQKDSFLSADIANISEKDDSICKTQVSCEHNDSADNLTAGIFNGWHISVCFGKSSSQNYAKAVALAQSAPFYHQQTDDGILLHQAVFSSTPSDFLKFVVLYEVVGTWKSSFVMINENIIDRKIVGKLNYCYGDKCRSGNNQFCFGASYMTQNPFGCHRLQVSACNHPWWSFYHQIGNKWVLDSDSLIQRINSYAKIYSLCPAFDYQHIIDEFHKLPVKLSNKQYFALIQKLEE